MKKKQRNKTMRDTRCSQTGSKYFF